MQFIAFVVHLPRNQNQKLMSATRVSRKEAEEIAKLVVKEKTDALNARRVKFNTHVAELYTASLPAGCIAMAKARPELFMSHSIEVKVGGYSIGSYRLPDGVPSYRYWESFNLSADKFAHIRTEFDAICAVRSKLMGIEAEIVGHVISLKTAKNIEDAYPEAVGYFETKPVGSQLPVISSSVLRNKLNEIS